MASEPDDNPFARNSAWPKMPQAPFKVGPLPRAGAAPPPAPTTAPPATITPVFVRPVDPEPMAAPSLLRTPPPAAPAPAPAAIAQPPPPPVAPVVELPELIVQPPQRPRTAAPVRRRSRMPVVAAAVVGLAGLTALAVVFTQGREAAGTDVSPPTDRPAAAVTASPSPPAPAVDAPRQLAAAPSPSPTPATLRPARVSPAPRPAPVAPAEAAAAAAEMITAPVIDLPPAAAAEPLPAYAPPAAPDPNAPMTTQRPY